MCLEIDLVRYTELSNDPKIPLGPVLELSCHFGTNL